MNTIVDESNYDDSELTVTPADTVDAEQPYVERFDLSVGRVRITDEESGESHWMWKAKSSEGSECVSGTPFDAIMGCVERVTGGEL